MEIKSGIYLSSMRDEHIGPYMALSDDPELTATMGWAPFGPEEQVRFKEFCRVLSLPGLENGHDLVFSIICAADESAIGYVAIKGINRVEARAEIGIAIVTAEHRGKGYGTAAMRQVIDHAFIELGLTRLGLTVFPSNRRAIRSYEKNGFRRTEVLRDSWQFPDGEYSDLLVMELFRG